MIGRVSSKFDRFQWFPLWPTLLLAYFIWKLARNGPSFIGIIGGLVILLWFLGAWFNVFSKGKLLDWLNSSDAEDDDLPVIPDSFSAYENSASDLTPLQKAISESFSGDRELAGAIDELDLESVTEERDAIAICAALQDCAAGSGTEWEHLLPLLAIPGSARVYRIFNEQALPLLRRIFLKRREEADEEESEVLFPIIKLFVGYGFVAGFQDVVEASRDPKFSEKFRWVSVFGSADKDDPDSVKLNALMAESLPIGFARIAFLDWSNEWCINSILKSHPFDSDEGVAVLEGYLSDPDSDNFSYAVSAAVAVAFISEPKRNSLIALSRDHPDPHVQLECAWAMARLKMPIGIRDLSNATLDWRIGATAKRYMEELGLRDEIPPGALDPRHLAISAMAEWLAHPNELGRFPDSLTILDQRELHWPATDSKQLQTLLHWKLGDDEGVSWTGSTTWALFSCAERDMPILDLYAMYNSWQMRANKVPEAPESFSDLETGRAILLRANPGCVWES